MQEFCLHYEDQQKVLQAVRGDCEILQQCGLMDYSILIGTMRGPANAKKSDFPAGMYLREESKGMYLREECKGGKSAKVCS